MVYLGDTGSANMNKLLNCDFNPETGVVAAAVKRKFIKLTWILYHFIKISVKINIHVILHLVLLLNGGIGS